MTRLVHLPQTAGPEAPTASTTPTSAAGLRGRVPQQAGRDREHTARTGNDQAFSRAPEPESARYRIVVADDTYLVREGIRSALERDEDEVEVVEFCSDLGSLLHAVEVHRPDVVITGIRMRPTNTDEGIRAANALRESDPEIGVLVVSQSVSSHHALKLFEHGSDGRAYLLMEHIRHRIQLMEAIREVAAGGSVIDPKVVDVLVEARMRAQNSLLARLSAREREVLASVATGASNAAIAQSLFLTKRAVEKNINSLFAKLDLRDDKTTSRRVRAALLALAETNQAS
jgi:DNA-binding NarL/FixJ family response regulator